MTRLPQAEKTFIFFITTKCFLRIRGATVLVYQSRQERKSAVSNDERLLT